MATKLISFRIEEEQLEKLDEYAEEHLYLSRSSILHHMLYEILNENWKHNLWVLTHTDKKILL